MSWVLISKNIERLFEFRLLYLAMSGQIPRCRAMINKIMFGEKALCASIVSGGEVNLSKKESIIGVI